MSKEDSKKRIDALKRLREKHQDTVARAQAQLKEQKAIRRQICQAMRGAPKTVPEVATTAGLPADQVLWHIIALKKYDLAVETGMCGEYYLYQLAEEAKK
jgi:predicted Rossmann fold nucleotide-binding protein DprA/Smf involved in DNA uptake